MAEIENDDAIIRQLIMAVRDPDLIVPRNGHKEADKEWTARAVRCVLDGRLLPSGGEVSTQWGARVVWKHRPLDEGPLGTREEAEEYGREHAARGYIFDALLSREVRRWPGGVYYCGPWVPVVSDNQESNGG